jgi:hypothetical protein
MGERDLRRLLAGLAPVVRPVPYVVVETDAVVPAAAVIVEDEATTKIIEQAVADAYGLSYTFVAAWITCTIESDLEAIGMTAALSRALADADISCNVLAASRHDHLLVPWRRRDDAVSILSGLAHGADPIADNRLPIVGDGLERA